MTKASVIITVIIAVVSTWIIRDSVDFIGEYRTQKSKILDLEIRVHFLESKIKKARDVLEFTGGQPYIENIGSQLDRAIRNRKKEPDRVFSIMLQYLALQNASYLELWVCNYSAQRVLSRK